MFHITFALIPYFDWLLGPQKGNFSKIILQNLLFRNCLAFASTKKSFLFQSDNNSGCYGNFQFPKTYNDKSENLLVLQFHWRYLNFAFAENVY